MKYQLYKPQAINELGGRKNQEDSIYPLMGEAAEDNRVFVVCDGMGGMDKGEVASEAVCKTIGRVAEQILKTTGTFKDEDLQHCLQEAYNALDAADVMHEGTMGTTMTFLCMHSKGCLVAHIGDSRIYHLRPSLGADKGVLYRSRDHSLVQQLYELGEISYNEMGTSPRKNIILRAMQPYQEQRTKATLAHITDVQPDDYFYLCTDGMLERMEDDEIMSIVGHATMSDEEKKNELIARTVGNADNHSAYLIKVKDVISEPADKDLKGDEEQLRAKNKCLNDQRKDVAWSEEESAPAPMPPVEEDTTETTHAAPKQTKKRASRKPIPVKSGHKTTLISLFISAVALVAGIIMGILLFIVFP